MADVVLVPMTAADLEAFILQEIADCAEQGICEGRWRRPEALTRARDELTAVVERERHAAVSEGHRLYTALSATGERVGWLWVKRPAAGGAPASAFLCQMTVARGRRRQGYGRAMLLALEALLAEDGVGELRLNVWASNLPAKRLYESAGYTLLSRCETICQLRKSLAAPRPLTGAAT